MISCSTHFVNRLYQNMHILTEDIRMDTCLQIIPAYTHVYRYWNALIYNFTDDIRNNIVYLNGHMLTDDSRMVMCQQMITACWSDNNAYINGVTALPTSMDTVNTDLLSSDNGYTHLLSKVHYHNLD